MSLQNKPNVIKKSAAGRKWKIPAVILVIFILGGFTFFHLLKVQPPSVRNVADFSSTAERDQMAYGLDRRVKTLANTLQERRGQKTDLVVGEKELNAYIQASPDIQKKLQSAGASDPVVKLDQNKIIASAYVPVNGNRLPITAAIDVIPGADGSMVIDISSLKVGVFPVPSSIASKIESRLMDMKNRKVDLPPGVTGINVEDGKLIVKVDPQYQIPR